MTYFNRHDSPTMIELSRRIHADNLRMLPPKQRAVIAKMPTRTIKELATARQTSEAARCRIKARLRGKP